MTCQTPSPLPRRAQARARRVAPIVARAAWLEADGRARLLAEALLCKLDPAPLPEIFDDLAETQRTKSDVTDSPPVNPPADPVTPK